MVPGRRITRPGPQNQSHARLELSSPFGSQMKTWRPVVATGFEGYATIPVDRAKRLSLELWEIPGKIKILGVFQSGDCRRARMRCQIGALGIDYRLPVAVWVR